MTEGVAPTADRPANRVISSWFYVQDATDGGTYAQVSGHSWTTHFRDVYRRCIAVFFASARRANPDAELRLYLNREWDTSESAVAREVMAALSHLGVSLYVVEYTNAPPASWTRWRNQFFVLDVAAHIVQSTQPNDLVVILDSDMVWTGKSTAEQFWHALSLAGLVALDVGYEPTREVNGLSREGMAELLTQVRPGSPSEMPIYAGGELIAARADILERVHSEAVSLLADLQQLPANTESRFEEAHLLSLAYHVLELSNNKANRFAKRIWSQPLKPRNGSKEDLNLAMWHLPAEKKYGLRRIYEAYRSDALLRFTQMEQVTYMRLISRSLGVPSNSAVKFARDVTFAARSRAIRALDREMERRH